jgi:cellulose biosynthesis protein BcsQ
MKVINFYGGPGTGKSTTAAGLFYKMKSEGYKVELVTEYAKDVVYQESFFKLKDQLYIFTKQHHKLWKLRGKVDYVITDSPLLLSLHYFTDNDVYNKDHFFDFVRSTFNSYENINIFITRNEFHPYQNYGRTQTEDEAIEVDRSIRELLDKNKVLYNLLPIDSGLINNVHDIIKLS